MHKPSWGAIKKVGGSIVTLILILNGITETSENAAKWQQWLVDLWNLPGIDWAGILSNNADALFLTSGVAVGLWAWDVPERVAAKWRGESFRHHPPVKVEIRNIPEPEESPNVDKSLLAGSVIPRILGDASARSADRAEIDRLKRELQEMTKLRDVAEREARKLGRVARDLRNPPRLGEAMKRHLADEVNDIERAAQNLRDSSATTSISKEPTLYTVSEIEFLEVFVVPNVGAGTTPGASIKGRSRYPSAVEGMALTVMDLLVWDEEIEGGKFVSIPDIYGQSVTFPQPTTFNERHTLHPNSPVSFGFIRAENKKLSIEGHPQRYVTRRRGIWELSYRIGPKDLDQPAKKLGKLYFEWTLDGEVSSVKPCDPPTKKRTGLVLHIAEGAAQIDRSSMCPRSATELLTMIDNKTALQREALMDPYLGLKLSARGNIDNVRKHGDGYHVSILLDEKHPKLPSFSIKVNVSFGPGDARVISALNVGDSIEAIGAIKHVELLGIDLSEGRLVSYGAPKANHG